MIVIFFYGTIVFGIISLVSLLIVDDLKKVAEVIAGIGMLWVLWWGVMFRWDIFTNADVFVWTLFPFIFLSIAAISYWLISRDWTQYKQEAKEKSHNMRKKTTEANPRSDRTNDNADNTMNLSQLIKCTKCGKTNRINKQKHLLGLKEGQKPVCGNCHEQL